MRQGIGWSEVIFVMCWHKLYLIMTCFWYFIHNIHAHCTFIYLSHFLQIVLMVKYLNVIVLGILEYLFCNIILKIHCYLPLHKNNIWNEKIIKIFMWDLFIFYIFNMINKNLKYLSYTYEHNNDEQIYCFF